MKMPSMNYLQKGASGNIFIITILGLLIGAGAIAVGGMPSELSPKDGTAVKVVPPKDDPKHSNLQLQTFGFVTIAPTPNNTGQLCQAGGVNNEPEILVGYAPASGQTVSATGQVKVWVNDEGAPFIAQNEQVNLSTGQITSPGDRTGKAADNFLFEPALYISPQTAETGGTPHFPTAIKGTFNNNPAGGRGPGTKGAPFDTPPAGSQLDADYTAEMIWDVSSLGLAAGSYQAEFVIHDGDRDRGVGCVNLVIQ
jgi:hypothetical protein